MGKKSKKRAAAAAAQGGRPSKKQKTSASPEVTFNHKFEQCCQAGNIDGALELFNTARETGSRKLDLQLYNHLLHLCACVSIGGVPIRYDPRNAIRRKEGNIVFRGHMAALVPQEAGSTPISKEAMEHARNVGPTVFEQMKGENVSANEATYTALARIAAANKDGDLAFAIVQDMIEAGLNPKLRSYGPALYAYFSNNQVDEALNVLRHMRAANIEPEEMELHLVLDLCARAGLQNEVYSLLYDLRVCATEVHPSTAKTIENWFRSKAALRATGESLEQGDVKKELKVRGGGGHQLGWLGSGKWTVQYTTVNEAGTCQGCGQTLASVDLDPRQTQLLADGIATLARQNEKQKGDFNRFQQWLAVNTPFVAIVDGANVALNSQSVFNFQQLDSVVKELERRYGSTPLIVLGFGRTTAGPAKTQQAQEMIKRWENANALYRTPGGSNDDWYWLYAAIDNEAKLVTNDELRDHAQVQLLGGQIAQVLFPRWKERHQVRYQFKNSRPELRIPPPYSFLIQESETGAWHIPIKVPRGQQNASSSNQNNNSVKWLCVTR